MVKVGKASELGVGVTSLKSFAGGYNRACRAVLFGSKLMTGGGAGKPWKMDMAISLLKPMNSQCFCKVAKCLPLRTPRSVEIR